VAYPYDIITPNQHQLIRVRDSSFHVPRDQK